MPMAKTHTFVSMADTLMKMFQVVFTVIDVSVSAARVRQPES